MRMQSHYCELCTKQATEMHNGVSMCLKHYNIALDHEERIKSMATKTTQCDFCSRTGNIVRGGLRLCSVHLTHQKTVEELDKKKGTAKTKKKIKLVEPILIPTDHYVIKRAEQDGYTAVTTQRDADGWVSVYAYNGRESTPLSSSKGWERIFQHAPVCSQCRFQVDIVNVFGLCSDCVTENRGGYQPKKMATTKPHFNSWEESFTAVGAKEES